MLKIDIRTICELLEQAKQCLQSGDSQGFKRRAERALVLHERWSSHRPVSRVTYAGAWCNPELSELLGLSEAES